MPLLWYDSFYLCIPVLDIPELYDCNCSSPLIRPLKNRKIQSHQQKNHPKTTPTANTIGKQYTASAKSSALDQVAKALASLGQTLKNDRKLTTIIGAPTLTTADKQEVVNELQKLAGGADKGDILKNFLSTLAENNRLGTLEGVCEKFGTLMGAHRGELELNITSAQVCLLRAVCEVEEKLMNVGPRQQDHLSSGEGRHQV